jgi:hypothetical protein
VPNLITEERTKPLHPIIIRRARASCSYAVDHRICWPRRLVAARVGFLLGVAALKAALLVGNLCVVGVANREAARRNAACLVVCAALL